MSEITDRQRAALLAAAKQPKSAETRARMSAAAKARWARDGEHERMRAVARSGESNPAWVGDDASSTAVHLRLRTLHGPARSHRCLSCGGAAAEWAFLWQDVPREQWRRSSSRAGPFTHNPADYGPMCRPCHRRYDRAPH